MTPQEMEQFDRALAEGRASWTRDLAIAYVGNIRSHPEWTMMCEIKEFSMLAAETLLMCRGYGLAAKSGVIEIGAYVGGSTVALGMGIEAAGRKPPMVTVDVGGSYLEQPVLPSSDIHADWRKNVASRGLDGISKLVGGKFQEEATIQAVKNAANGAKFDVFLLDADGEIKAALDVFSDQLADDCLLILDDYYNVSGNLAKAEILSRQVHQLMAEGVVEQYALTPFSTWFGRLTKRPDSAQ